MEHVVESTAGPGNPKARIKETYCDPIEANLVELMAFCVIIFHITAGVSPAMH